MKKSLVKIFIFIIGKEFGNLYEAYFDVCIGSFFAQTEIAEISFGLTKPNTKPHLLFTWKSISN